MAARYTTGSGDWSSVAIWDGGASVPGNLDTATVTVGHTVALNSDYSGITLAGITINGTLNVCTSASAYLKTNGDINGSGTFNCGGYTGGVIDPSLTLATNLTFKLDFAASAKGINSSNLVVNFYCWNPAVKYALLSGAEAVGQTDLEIDTAEATLGWQAFLTASGLTGQFRINDISGTLPDSELRNGTVSTTTVTVTSGLTAAKTAGSYVVLITRNIQVGNTTGYAINAAKAGSVLGQEISSALGTTTNGTNGGANYIVAGTMSGCTTGLYYGAGHTNNSIISGCTYGINYGAGHTNNSIIIGCTNGIRQSSGYINIGVIRGCLYGISQSMAYLRGGTLNNTIDIVNSEIRANNSTFSGTTDNSGYLFLPNNYSYSKDHNGVAGDFKAWSGGGYVLSEKTIVPAGATYSYKHTCQTVSYPCIRQEEFYVEPGHTLSLTGYFKLAADFTGITPKLEILNTNDLSALDSDAVADPADVTNWQTVIVSWTNTATYGQTVVVRASAQRASGDLYEAWVVTSEVGTYSSSRFFYVGATGLTIKARIYGTDGTRRDNPDREVIEITGTGIYIGYSRNLIQGDIIAFYDTSDSTVNLSCTEYLPISGINSVKTKELVSNGDFLTDTVWSKDTGWTITGGVAVYTSIGPLGYAISPCISQPTNEILHSKKYRIIYTLSDFSCSPGEYVNVTLFNLSGGTSSVDRNSNGTFSEIVTMVGDAVSIQFGTMDNGTLNFKLDNLSIKEVVDTEDVSTSDIYEAQGSVNISDDMTRPTTRTPILRNL